MQTSNMLDKMDWYIMGRILIADFTGTVDIKDIEKSAKLALVMLNNDNQPPVTHLIVNATQVNGIDATILKLHPMRKAMTPVLSSPHIGWLVLVDPDPNHVILFIIKTIAELTSRRLRVAQTLEEALQFIDDIDPSIKLPSDNA